MEFTKLLLIIVFAVFCIIKSIDSKSRKPKQLATTSETNIANFFRLVLMRLIFGLATSMGFGEGISNFLGGVLVPPGVDYDDYYGDDEGGIVPDIF